MLSSRVRSTTLSAVLAGRLAAVVISRAQNSTDLKPSPQALDWQDLEFGVLIHFGPNTFLGKEWGDGTASPATFNPTQFDPEQWMKAIKSAGARYVHAVTPDCNNSYCEYDCGSRVPVLLCVSLHEKARNPAIAILPALLEIHL